MLDVLADAAAHGRVRRPFADLTNVQRAQIAAVNEVLHPPAKQIVDILAIQHVRTSVRTVQRVIQRARETGSSAKMHKGGNRKHDTITADERSIILNAQRKDNTLTLAQLREQLPIPRARSTIHSVLGIADFTTKNVYARSILVNAPSTKARRVEYVKWALGNMDHVPPWHRPSYKPPTDRNMIFVDETPTQQSMTRKRGRMLRGFNATTEHKVIKGQNVSVVAAVHPRRGLLCYRTWLPRKRNEVYVRGKQTTDFVDFIGYCCYRLKKENLNYPHHFVMDNASFHNSARINTYLKQEGSGHRLQFLPPYSPDLNPIENCFGIWKAHIKHKKMKTTEELLESIREASYKLNRRLVKKCARHSRRFFPRARRLMDF